MAATAERQLTTFLEHKLRAERLALEILEYAQSAWAHSPEHSDILAECERVYNEAVAERKHVQEKLHRLRADIPVDPRE